MESAENVLTNVDQSVNSVLRSLLLADSTKKRTENQKIFNGKTNSNSLNKKIVGKVSDVGNNATSNNVSKYGPVFQLIDGKYVQIGETCKACGASFTTRHELSDHQNNGIKYYCGECKLLFRCKKTVKMHLQTHIADSGVSPQEPSKPTNSKLQNKPDDDEDVQFQCKECGKFYTSESTMRRHCKTHSKLITCDKCNKEFSMEDFQIHIKSSKCSKRKTVFKCKECKKKFLKLSTLNTHIKTHTKPYSCKDCGKSFSKKRAMEHHQSIRKCVLECKDCGKSFSSRIDLRKHLNTHKKFECTECGKLYASKNALVTHENIHKGLSFVCEVCGKSFATLNYMRSHKKNHEPLMFNCEECGKSFSIKSKLQRHLKIHEGLKPFQCELCGKGFAEKSGLQGHMVYHVDARLFECETCGKGFKTKHNLSWHNKTVKCKKD
eukprot:TCONS_00049312-protein